MAAARHHRLAAARAKERKGKLESTVTMLIETFPDDDEEDDDGGGREGLVPGEVGAETSEQGGAVVVEGEEEETPLLKVTQSSPTDRGVQAEVGVDGDNAEDEEGEEYISATKSGCSSEVVVSLLQVSFPSHALLFDLWSLHSTPSLATKLNHIMTTILSHPYCLKLGCGLAGDLRVLRSSWPTTTAWMDADKISPVLDLQQAARCLQGAKKVVGLSVLCHQYLGKPLDKGEQVSDWDLRPLTDEQVG